MTLLREYTSEREERQRKRKIKKREMGEIYICRVVIILFKMN